MTVHDFTVTTATGGSLPLGDYAGRPLLIVNVASKCGFTPQYEGLEALYRARREEGLEILAFPCNQFGGQEPGTTDEILEFCSTAYDVTFPVLAKVDVNGPDADPLFTYLRAQAPGDFGPHLGMLYDYLTQANPDIAASDDVKWNFTKFLVDGGGRVVRRYESPATPEQIGTDLVTLLG